MMKRITQVLLICICPMIWQHAAAEKVLVFNDTNNKLYKSNTTIVDMATGNVGIGTTSPTAKLDVNGSVAFTGLTEGMFYYNGTHLVNLGNGTNGTYLKSVGTSVPQWANVTTLSYMNVEVFTSSGTFTKPSGISRVFVEVLGAGASGQTGGSTGAGVGGGAGGYCAEVCNITTDVTVTVGAGGASGNNNGGASSFGAFCSANGGSYTGTGGTASGGDINIQGQHGFYNVTTGSTINGFTRGGGAGGSSIYGFGGKYSLPDTGGESGTGYGAGGSGGGHGGSSKLGGAGTDGVVIVRY